MRISNQQIVAYWVEHEVDLVIDWSTAHERCWRCGYRSSLEQHLVVPASMGGTRALDNVVLLCGRCVSESPSHLDPGYLWRWLRATSVSVSAYDTYWTLRGWEEFEVIFGRKPLECFKEAAVDHRMLNAECRALAADEFAKTVVRFGEGRLNPSTIACVIAEVEKKLADRHGITLP
ncbi:HNH endonuclease signature motif containing protein [Lentzea sp. NPDC003310]|uniref:HNH endonuclease n=1 Tax=Lentzea sp. NPDC003310 TaxID=3154447 RepID=UPI0033B6C337